MRLSILITLLVSVVAEVQRVSDADFDSVVTQSGKWTLVDFYADWCRHCKQLEPIYAQVAELFEGVDSVQILKMNGDADGRKMASKLKLEGFPLLHMFHNDDEPLTYVGGRNVEAISNFVQLVANVRLPTAEELAEPSKVIQLSDLSFEELVLDHKTARSLVFFTADWCGYCVKLEPVLEKLANQIYVNDGESIQIIQIQTTKVAAEKLMKQFAVDSFPTVMLFDPFKKDEDGLKRPVKYHGDRSLGSLVEFANEHAGLHRTSEGRILENGGSIEYLDAKLTSQVIGKDAGAAIEFLQEIDTYAKLSASQFSKRDEVVAKADDLQMLPYYRKLTNKIINGEDGFFAQELDRLRKIVKTSARSMQPRALDSMEKRINVLQRFVGR